MYPSTKHDYSRSEFMDQLYDWVDEKLLAGEFETVNTWLVDIKISECDIDFMLGILTTTLPARNKLSNRAKIYERIEVEIKKREGRIEQGLLDGLQ